MRRRAGLLCFGILLLLSTATTADARRRRAVAPVLVRLTGYIGEHAGATAPQFRWPVTVDGAKVTLNVIQISLPSGGTTPLEIDTALAPYRMKFTVTGRREVVQPLALSTADQPVRVTGYLRLEASGRYLMLDSVAPEHQVQPAPGE